jgi:hypothetical protein
LGFGGAGSGVLGGDWTGGSMFVLLEILEKIFSVTFLSKDTLMDEDISS